MSILSLAVIVLGLAVLLGGALAVVAMRRRAAAPPWLLAWLHGIAALGGYGLLIAALVLGPARGAETGTQSFGVTAAVLLALAVLFGILSLMRHRARRRMPGAAIGVHASVAIFGYVILAVYLLAG